MKLLYIANIRIPTEKAHGIQIMKMCEAFSEQGTEVELIVPRRFNRIKDNPFKYYGVKENFKIKKLPTIDLVNFGKFGFLIQAVSFAKFAVLYSIFNKADVIYSRDEIPVFFISLFRRNIFWESHTNTYNFFVKRFIKKIKGTVTITENLKNFYVNKGIDSSRILVAHDAVDIKKFEISLSKIESRDKLSLPKDKKIVMYTGHLYGWKGVDTLAKSADFLDSDTVVVFVGGTDECIEKFKNKYTSKNILILGRKLHKEIPYYLKSADVLVLPNTAKDETSRLYTSPMKLFEYMASGAPIVASDLPSIKEVLNNKNGFFFKPDSPKLLAEKIIQVLNDEFFTNTVAEQAKKDVGQSNWINRAGNIISFVGR